MKAQTQNLTSTTRKNTAEARIIEQFGEPERLQGLEEQGWKINILKKQFESLGITNNMTAAHLAQFNRTMEDMIAMVKNARTVSDIDRAALERVASIGGVEINKIKPLLDLVIQLFGNRGQQEIPRFK